MLLCTWLTGHSSWMWWMLGGGRRRGRERKTKKKGIEKKKKHISKRNFYFHFFPHPLSRHINNGHFFNAPHMLHADVDAVSSYFSISHSTRHSFFPFFRLSFIPPTTLLHIHFYPSDVLKWDFLNRKSEGHNKAGGHSALTLFHYFFFDVSFVKKIVISAFVFSPTMSNYFSHLIKSP